MLEANLDMNADQIVDRFIREQGVDQKFKVPLVNMIQEQIQNIINKN